MDRMDFNQFMRELDLEKIDVEQEYEYDEPSNVMILKPKTPLNVSIESEDGFMSFLVEEFHFDAIYQRLSLIFDGIDVFSLSLRKIKKILHSEADMESVAYEKNKAAAYEAMYGIEYGSRYEG